MLGYGHVGDGNIHLTVNCKDPKYGKEIENRIEKFIIEYVMSMKGSISAEHGLGQHKAKYLKQQKGLEVEKTMRQFKELLDPKGILNPTKVFV